MSKPDEMSRDYIPVAQTVPYEEGLEMFHAAASDPALFVIVGSEFSEVIEFSIPPGMTISAEPGTMVHMSKQLHPYVDVGSVGQGFKRCCCAGESCCRLNFTNKTQEKQVLALTGNLPGRVVPINLADYPHGFFFRAKAFLAAVGTDWRIDLEITKFSVGCFGGFGFVLNKITGSGWGFLNAGGTVMQKLLKEGEVIVVDQKSVVGFESTVKFEVQFVTSLGVLCCGGMGIANAKFTGPGLVFMESMGPSKLAQNL